jgi:hypothetical protein
MLRWLLITALAASAAACSSEDAGGALRSSEGRREMGWVEAGAGRSVGLEQSKPTPDGLARPLSLPQPEPPTDLTRSDCRVSDAPRHFFPPFAFFVAPDATPLDDFLTSWYSRALRLAREASLSCTPPPTDAYRLLILHSGPFTEVAIDVVHIQVDGDRGNVSTSRLHADRDLRVGRLDTTARRRLRSAEVSGLLGQIDKSNLWSMPRNEDLRFACSVSVHVLEGRSRDRYRVVQGISPLEGEFRVLCGLVAELGGLSCR